MSIPARRTPAEIEHLHENLARRLGDSSLPTLPQVAIEVLNLVDNPNSGIRDFADVIKADQALTGRMLRLANSAAYAQRGEVTDLQRAIVLLGLERTKAMALGFHLSESMKGCAHTGTLWTHSLMRAWMAFHIAECFNKSITGQAFIIGLMLDAGVGVMASLVGESYHDQIELSMNPVKLYEKETRSFEFTHVDLVTVMTTKMWRFPDTLAKPIKLHHDNIAKCNTQDDALLLRAVAHYVGTFPLDASGEATPDRRMESLGRTLFGMKQPELREMLGNAATDFDATKQMFGSVIDPKITVQSILENANNQLGAEPDTHHEDLEGGSLKFEGSETCLELAGKNGNRVEAYLTDTDGNRLFSITIDPAKQTTDQIREELMLDQHTPEQAEKIMRAIQKFAA